MYTYCDIDSSYDNILYTAVNLKFRFEGAEIYILPSQDLIICYSIVLSWSSKYVYSRYGLEVLVI